MVKILTLIENMVSRGGLIAEHGLSYLISTDTHNILFDTGSGPNFISNAKKLGVDLILVDIVVISHGHYDHTGGLPFFLEINDHAKIYLKKEALLPKYKGERYIGVNNSVDYKNPRFEFVNETLEIEPDILIIPDIELFFKGDTHINGFSIDKSGIIEDDTFRDELFLCIIKNRKLNVISSCSHNGITNICETVRSQFHLPIERVIGGFHLKDSDSKSVDHVADYFNMTGVSQVYTGHCTSIERFVDLVKKGKSEMHYFQTGNEMIIE